MAASNDSLILFKYHQTYCCDPFKEQKSRRAKDLRNVTDRQAQEHPSLVSIGEQIYSNCHKRLGTLSPAETKLSSDEQQEQQDLNDYSFTHDQFFALSEDELSSLNISLEFIRASLFNKYRAQKGGSYVLKKIQKIQDASSQKIVVLCGPSKQWVMEDEEALSDNESHAMQDVLTSLIQKYQNALSGIQKITILTIFANTWSRRRIMEKFGCSLRMATQATRLAIEKGILSTPNPKVGRGLQPDTDFLKGRD